MKQAILAVSFGTSHHDTLAKTIAAIETALATAFPDYTVRRAFTSGMIMRKLAQEGTVIDNVPTALAKLVAEGYTRVIVQPTHIMNGDEYDKLMAQAAPFATLFDSLSCGAPLLTTVADYRQVAQVLVGNLPLRQADTAIVYMGHGTGHFANSAYAQMHYLFHDMGRSDIIVGTVEGYPEFDEVTRRIAELGAVKHVILYPMMIVAGDHAKNDLAGDEEDSWKSMLEAQGYQVSAVLQGLGELPGIQSLFVNHTKEAMACE